MFSLPKCHEDILLCFLIKMLLFLLSYLGNDLKQFFCSRGNWVTVTFFMILLCFFFFHNGTHICIKFKSRHNYSMDSEVRIMFALEQRDSGWQASDSPNCIILISVLFHNLFFSKNLYKVRKYTLKKITKCNLWNLFVP